MVVFRFSNFGERLVVAVDHFFVGRKVLFVGAVGDDVAVLWEEGRPIRRGLFGACPARWTGRDRLGRSVRRNRRLGYCRLADCSVAGRWWIGVVAEAHLFAGLGVGQTLGLLLLLAGKFDHDVEIGDDAALGFLGNGADILVGEARLALIHAVEHFLHFVIGVLIGGGVGQLFDKLAVVNGFGGVGIHHGGYGRGGGRGFRRFDGRGCIRFLFFGRLVVKLLVENGLCASESCGQ